MIRYTYRFSIIIAAYNAENYIKDTLESVINQSMSFKNNVEIIIVDDGSTDSTSIICAEYVNKYPDNIKYFYKSNGGVSSARNYGIKLAKGKYLNFLDSDDLLSPDALSTVYDFFEKNKFEIDMVTLPIEYFEKQEGLHPRYKNIGNFSHIIDLEKKPQEYVFSCAASFYKNRLFKEFKFNTNLHLAEDLYLNTKLFLNNPKYGVISPTEAVYYYRKRYNENSVTNSNEYNQMWLIDVFDYLYKGILRHIKTTKKPMPDFIKYIFIYNVAIRIKMPHFVSTEVLIKFYTIAENMLSHVDEDQIIEYPHKDYFNMVMLLMIKNREYDLKKCLFLDSKHNVCLKGKIIGNVENYNFQISSIRTDNDKLYIDGFFNDIIGQDFKAKYKYNDDYFDIATTKTSDNFLQRRFFDKVVGQAYNLNACIPLTRKGKHTIYLNINQIYVPIKLKNAYSETPILYETSVKVGKENIKIKIDDSIIEIL